MLIPSDLIDELDAQLSYLVGADYDAKSAYIKPGWLTAFGNALDLWIDGGTGLSGTLPGGGFGSGSGLPTGGTTTQVLAKASNADFDVEWVDAGTPGAHATSHQDGGSDEIATTTPASGAIPKAGVSGRLGTDWLGSGSATASTLLHGDQSWGAVALGSQVSGDLPFANFVQSPAGFSLVAKADTGAGDYADLAIAADRVIGRAGSANIAGVTWTASGRALLAATIVQGDLIYGTGAGTIASLAKDTNATRYLSNTGGSNNPAWAQISLTEGVTGDLPYANLTQGTARSLLAVVGNATADWAPLQGTTPYHTVRVDSGGTGLEFALVDLTNQVTGDLPFASFVQAATGASVVARSAASAGDYAELAVSADSVLGRIGSGALGSITAGTDEVLRKSGTTLGFGTLVTNNYGNASITYAKIQNVTDARLLGRAAGVGGDVQELTVTGLSLAGGNLSGIGGTTGAIGNAILLANGTGGATVKGSSWTIDGSDMMEAPAGGRIYWERLGDASYIGGGGGLLSLVSDSVEVVTPYITIAVGTGDNLDIIGINSPGSLGLPSGTTSQRPADYDVGRGAHRWNEDYDFLEIWDGTNWMPYFPVGNLRVPLQDVTLGADMNLVVSEYYDIGAYTLDLAATATLEII